jgi:hypothetical protein
MEPVMTRKFQSIHRSLVGSFTALALVALAPRPLSAEGVSVEEAAKFLLILASSAGSEGRVACKEMDMAMQLKKREISVDAKANLAWAFTPEQTKFYAGQGKLVVCNSRKLLTDGGSIAFERASGRLTIFYHPANLERSGVHLPESFLRGAVKI